MNDLAALPHHSMHQLLKLMLLFVPTIFLTSCTTNLYVSHNYKIAKPPTERPIVFVEKSELKKELSILKKSKLYEISEDPTVKKHIVLKPMTSESTHCGIGLLPALFSLGLRPGGLHQYRHFEYIVHDDNGDQILSYKLPHIFMRISLWEWFFKAFKNENRTYGMVLRTEVLRNPQKGSVNSGN